MRQPSDLARPDTTHTSSMAMTTIQVDADVRDRLAARAQAHGRSLVAELSAMLDDLMWQGIEDGYRRLAADEAEFAAYRRETAEWMGADLGGVSPLGGPGSRAGS
jgi:plasmid stability protein